MARIKLFIPLFVFLILASLFYFSLGRDSEYLPSALIGKRVPNFELAQLDQPDRLLGVGDISGQAALLNVWASWCYSCRVEHPQLQKLVEEHGVHLYGLNYKDEPAAARQWLEQFGDPYRLSISDINGSLGLDLGVSGAPETYILDAKGVVRYRHIGVITEKVWQRTIRPMLEEYGAPLK